MRAAKPYVDVPGDNPQEPPDKIWLQPRIMARGGDLVGMNREFAVWRFGFRPGSEASTAYGISLPEGYPGFLWVLATRKTGKIKESWIGYAIDLPAKFRNIIDFEVT